MRPADQALARPIPMPAALAATLLLFLAACTGDQGAATSEASADDSPSAVESVAEESAAESMEAEGQVVNITDTTFNTDEITVSAGTTVTFVNNSTLPHTVTEGQDGNAVDDARFDEPVNQGQSVEITFSETGDFDVTCLFHGNMNMVVHVQ